MARRSAAQLILIMNGGQDQGYFPETAKSLFISDNLKEKEAEKRQFEQTGSPKYKLRRLQPLPGGLFWGPGRT